MSLLASIYSYVYSTDDLLKVSGRTTIANLVSITRSKNLLMSVSKNCFHIISVNHLKCMVNFIPSTHKINNNSIRYYRKRVVSESIHSGKRFHMTSEK